MKIIGIPLRTPGFSEVTAAVIMGSGLWILAVGLMQVAGIETGRTDAGALLVVMLWGCVSARVGIRVGAGGRHLVANLVVTALLLGAYQGAWAAFAG